MPWAIWPISGVSSLINFIIWVHMIVLPIKVIEVDTIAGATVTEALVAAQHDVRTGFVCRSKDDIVCIDGLCNGLGFWTIEVNGDFAHTNSETVLKKGDKLEFIYNKR